MRLEQAIHERWAADAALAALVPPERFCTGRVAAERLPAASLIRAVSRPLMMTNAGAAMEETRVRILLWHDDYSAGRAAAEAVRAAFHRARFGLGAEGRVLSMVCAQERVRQRDDRRWTFALDFTATLSREA